MYEDNNSLDDFSEEEIVISMLDIGIDYLKYYDLTSEEIEDE